MRGMGVEKAMSINRPRPDLLQRLGSDAPTTPVDSGSSPDVTYLAHICLNKTSCQQTLASAPKGVGLKVVLENI
ncbi:MAG: hypothetical protein ACRERE_12355 [Candidatus Entotheonellia bacterium]